MLREREAIRLKAYSKQHIIAHLRGGLGGRVRDM